MKAGCEATVDRGVDHRQSHRHKKYKHESKLIVPIIPVKTQGVSCFAFLICLYFISVTDFTN